ncbi:MAG TPA: DUF4321 domain-containing protein [Nitrospiria bacterium]|nr:DUF4321 domain-containing protein [Nitrospiria bacterium]
MAGLKKGPGMFLLFTVIGGYVGAVLSEILRHATAGGPLSEFFIRTIHPGISPFTLNFELFSITFGFSFSLNLLSLLGIVLAIYLYKQA